MNRTLFALITFLAFAGTYLAGCGSDYEANAGCGHLFQRAVVHHAPVHHHVAERAIVLYGVGSDLAIEAAVERAFQRREARTPAEPRTAPPAEHPASPLSVLTAKCAKCHTEAKAQPLNGKWAVTDDFYRAATRMMGKGEGIPDEMKAVMAGLTPDDKGEITAALLDLDVAKGLKVKPVPAPEEPVTR